MANRPFANNKKNENKKLMTSLQQLCVDVCDSVEQELLKRECSRVPHQLVASIAEDSKEIQLEVWPCPINPTAAWEMAGDRPRRTKVSFRYLDLRTSQHDQTGDCGWPSTQVNSLVSVWRETKLARIKDADVRAFVGDGPNVCATMSMDVQTTFNLGGTSTMQAWVELAYRLPEHTAAARQLPSATKNMHLFA